MIAELLNTGKDNAQTGRDLCAVLHITIRDLTAAVEQERRDGQPICASTGKNPGYYLAADRREMQSYCDSLFRRAGEIHRTRKACLQSMNRLPIGG